jgi:uncharacterized protein YndB with AHSA1/START domain/DNA-binding transcriptional ArsR family regulator
MDDAVFKALAEEHRRTLLDRLFERDGQTLLELEAALPELTRFGVMKHVRVLESVGLVTSRKVGRERHHYLNPVPIRRIHDRWLDRYRIRAADLLDDLRATLEDQPMSAPDLAAATAPPAHVFVTYIRATPEAIWRALTESEFTTQYYYRSTVDSDWAPGSAYEYRIEGQLAIEGTVLEADPPRRLVMTFHATWDEKVAADTPSRLTWEIEDSGPGVCRLTVVHDGFDSRNETYGQVTGMTFILAGLKTLLETGQPLMGRDTPGDAGA